MAVDTAPRDDVVARVPTGLYIGGEWRDATGGGTLPVEDPGTGETLAHIADATAEDAIAALDAACAVQDEWQDPAARARRDPAPCVRGADRAHRRARAAHDAPSTAWSRIGREGGREGIEEYLSTKYFAIAVG